MANCYQMWQNLLFLLIGCSIPCTTKLFIIKVTIEQLLISFQTIPQCVSGGQKSREVILRKSSDSAEYTPKLVNYL